jgi:hypothetical protein
MPSAGRNSGPRQPRIPRTIAPSENSFRGVEIMLVKMMRALALVFVLAPFALPVRADAKPVVEVAFVLDTTGSMGPLIESAKRKIWSIATAIVDANPRAEVRIGLVAYRDIGDEYVTKKFDLTTDIQDLYANLLALQAHGGGDWPESVNEALHTAVTKLKWSQGRESDRIMFLVGDAPPHMDYAQDVKYPAVIRMAHERGIIVNAVQAGSARDTERVWREIAQLGYGKYIPIPQDGGHLVVIETPWDGDILELQGQMNGTVIPYGPRHKRSDVQDKVRQLAAAPRPVASEMASYLNKYAARTNGEVLTGSGDLVADVTNGRQKLATVKDDDLPDNFKAMKPAERQALIDRQSAKRKALNEKLTALVKQRDQYIVEQRQKAPARVADSFDRAVEETLRAQIK